MSKAYMEVHLFVIWPWAKRQRKIERYINKSFYVLDKFQPDWVDLTKEMGAFYGFDDRVEYPGAEPPTVYVVRILADRAARPTSTGMRMVNPHLFDAKKKMRKWGKMTGRLNPVHASDTQEEALENLNRLVPRYPDFETLLDLIPGYVILRHFEGEPDHGDVDILVEDLEEAVTALSAVRVDAYNNFTDEAQKDLKNKYLVSVGGRTAILDFRYVGDGYLDERWQQDILKYRVKQGILYRPGDSDWYWTLLYHALIHKRDVAEYEETLERLRPNAEHSRRALALHMQASGYHYTQPDDPLLSLFGVFIGKVADGQGWAGKAPQKGLEEQWEKACGYVPYPGTLNVEYDGRFVMPKPIYATSIAIVDINTKATAPVPLYFWNALINGHPCVLSTGGNLPKQIEVLAEVHLRTELGLETGDPVEVVVV